jgi:hypothetical protein
MTEEADDAVAIDVLHGGVGGCGWSSGEQVGQAVVLL